MERRHKTKDKDKEKREKSSKKDQEVKEQEKHVESAYVAPAQNANVPPIQIDANWDQIYAKDDESWNTLLNFLNSAAEDNAKLEMVAKFVGITEHHHDLRSSIVLDYHFLNLIYSASEGFNVEKMRTLFHLARELLEICSENAIDGLRGDPLERLDAVSSQRKYGLTFDETTVLLKDRLLSLTGTSQEKNKLFCSEETRKLIDYFSSFLKHFRLYRSVLSRGQSEDKIFREVEILTAASPLPLSGAVTEEQIRQKEEQRRRDVEELEIKRREAEESKLERDKADKLRREQDEKSEAENANIGIVVQDIDTVEQVEDDIVPPDLLESVATYVAAEQMQSLRVEMRQMIKKHQLMLDERIQRAESSVKKYGADD